jgi:hypothetical protein
MEKRRTTLFDTPLLGGEAPDGLITFKTGDGNTVEGSLAIFPIVQESPNKTLDLLGTGFFISVEGLFLTARHVLEAAIDPRSRKQIVPVAIMQFDENGSYCMRPILKAVLHPVADLAVGVAAPMTHNSDGTVLRNKIVQLTLNEIPVGSDVATYAYPRYESQIVDGSQILNVMPDFYDGKIVEHLPSGRDRVMLPASCYRTNMAIHHCASGGPVFSKNDNSVFALNSTGFNGIEDSYISSLKGILDLSIPDISIRGQAPRSASIRELIREGFIDAIPLP